MPYGKFSRQTYNGTISLVNSPKPSTQLNSSLLRSGISWLIRPCLSFDSGSHYPLQALATNTGIGTPASQVQQVSHSIRGCSFRYRKASTVSFWRGVRDLNPRVHLWTARFQGGCNKPDSTNSAYLPLKVAVTAHPCFLLHAAHLLIPTEVSFVYFAIFIYRFATKPHTEDTMHHRWQFNDRT